MANVQQAPAMMQTVAPDLYAQQLELQRRQQFADMLRQQSMTPQETQYVSGAGPTIAVKNSPLLGVIKMLQAGIAGSSQDAIDQKNTDLAKQFSGRYAELMGNTIPGGQGSPVPQNRQDQIISALRNYQSKTGDVGPTNDASQAVGALIPADQTSAPVSQSPAPQNGPDIKRAIMAATLMGNTDLANKLSEQAWAAYAPTDATKLANAAGADVAQANKDALYKSNRIEPIVNRGFGVLTTNPVTHQLENDPASMEGIRSIKGYESPVTLKTSTGQEVQLSPVEWKDYQATGNLPLRFLPQDLRDKLQKSVDSQGDPTQVNINVPQGRVSGTMSPSGIGQIGVSQTPFNQALDKDEAERVSKMNEDIYDKGTHAIDKVAQNNKMIELLPTITTGPLNKQITMLKNAAQSIGVDLGDPAPNQEFDKYAIQGALAAAKSIYGGRITNQDVTTQIASNPGATMGEKAIYQMLKWDNEARQRDIQKMTALGEFRRNGGDLREFPAYFAQKYPYEGVSAPEDGQTQGYTVPTPKVPTPVSQAKDNRPPIKTLIKIVQ